MPTDLYEAACAAMAKSYSPYSAFPVGASLRTSDGRIFAGCNIENASYPEGWCAETTALSNFVMDGGGEITEILVVAERVAMVTPCGGCRQRLAEFAKPDTILHLCDNEGIVESTTLGALLPLGFNAEALK